MFQSEKYMSFDSTTLAYLSDKESIEWLYKNGDVIVH